MIEKYRDTYKVCGIVTLGDYGREIGAEAEVWLCTLADYEQFMALPDEACEGFPTLVIRSISLDELSLWEVGETVEIVGYAPAGEDDGLRPNQ